MANMYPFNSGPDDSHSSGTPLSEEDQQLLFALVQRNGVPNLLCALTGYAESCTYHFPNHTTTTSIRDNYMGASI